MYRDIQTRISYSSILLTLIIFQQIIYKCGGFFLLFLLLFFHNPRQLCSCGKEFEKFISKTVCLVFKLKIIRNKSLGKSRDFSIFLPPKFVYYFNYQNKNINLKKKK